MRYAAIDVGTNSVRLLIVEEEAGRWLTLEKRAEIARLGEGVDKNRLFLPEAIERTVQVIVDFKRLVDRFAVEKSRVVSTSAARDAKNTSTLISAIEAATGLTLEVLSGDEEARLAFLGASSGTDSVIPPDTLALVIDVGGGSTELTTGVNGRLLVARSLDVGSVRLTESFIKHDPPLDVELVALGGHVEGLLTSSLAEVAPEGVELMVAVAGTATTLAAVQLGLDPYDPEKVHGSILSRGDLNQLLDQFIAVPLADRKRIRGLQPKRADVIAAGTIILQQALRALDLQQLVVSEKDILDGLVYSLAD